MQDDDSDTFEVKLANLIEFDKEYFSVDDPKATITEIVRKSVTRLKGQVGSKLIDFKSSQTPYICTNFPLWREEALDSLNESLENYLIHQRKQALLEFALLCDKEIVENFKNGVRKVYQQYAIAERLRFRMFDLEDYEEFEDENDEEHNFTGLEREVLDACAEWLLKVDLLLDLLSRCFSYGVLSEQKIGCDVFTSKLTVEINLLLQVTRKKLEEKWFSKADSADFKVVLQAVQRFLGQASDAKFLSCIRLRLGLHEKSSAVNAIAAIVGSDVFAVLIGWHNRLKTMEKDWQILLLIEKYNKNLEDYIDSISKQIRAYLEHDSRYELQKRQNIRNNILQLFIKLFSGQVLTAADHSEFEKQLGVRSVDVDRSPVARKEFPASVREKEEKIKTDSTQ